LLEINGFLAKAGFFFWAGCNSIGIDGVSVGFYLKTCLQVKEHRYGIRGIASTRAKGFSLFSLNIFHLFTICQRNSQLSIVNCQLGWGVLLRKKIAIINARNFQI
jgi:hypothetical protein